MTGGPLSLRVWGIKGKTPEVRPPSWSWFVVQRRVRFWIPTHSHSPWDTGIRDPRSVRTSGEVTPVPRVVSDPIGSEGPDLRLPPLFSLSDRKIPTPLYQPWSGD